MCASNSVTPPAPGVALGVALSLIPAAVILVMAVVLNWGR